MAYKSLGREAVGRDTKPLHFEARVIEKKCVSCNLSPEFHEKVIDYCKENQITLAQFMRYALSTSMQRHTA